MLSEEFKDRLLDRGWVEGRSKAELIQIVHDLVQIVLEQNLELQAMGTEPTEQVAIDSVPYDFPDVEVEEYIRLPIAEAKEGEWETVWRIVLISSDPSHRPLGLEIHDSITLGRETESISVDLDLTGYDGERLGISRLHARIRPTQDTLLLADLYSTNGTFCNGVRLRGGGYQRMKDGDTVSFGALHFKVKVVSQPPPPEM